MARTRMIKPEFWDDEKLATVSRDTRLLFVGLWSNSDDYGVVKGHPAWLKNRIFPYDEIPLDIFEGWLAELAAIRVIVPFLHNGERYCHIRNFRRHQTINRPSGIRNPAPPETPKDDEGDPEIPPEEGGVEPETPPEDAGGPEDPGHSQSAAPASSRSTHCPNRNRNRDRRETETERGVWGENENGKRRSPGPFRPVLEGLPEEAIQGAGGEGLLQDRSRRAVLSDHDRHDRAGHDIGGVAEGGRKIHSLPGDVAWRAGLGGRDDGAALGRRRVGGDRA